MIRILIWGTVVGYLADSWQGKVAFSAFLALWACGELFFLMRKKNLGWIEKKRLKNAGMSEDDITAFGEKVFEENKLMLEQSGLKYHSPKVYIMQFLSYFIRTLVVAFVVGYIKQVLF